MNQSWIALLMSVSLLTACGGKDEKGGDKKSAKEKKPAESLQGQWEIMRAEGPMADMNKGTVYAFEGENLTLGLGSFKNPGKTVITDTSFSFQADGNELKFSYNYHFNGDTLVVVVPNSNGQVFHMIKK